MSLLPMIPESGQLFLLGLVFVFAGALFRKTRSTVGNQPGAPSELTRARKSIVF